MNAKDIGRNVGILMGVIFVVISLLANAYIFLYIRTLERKDCPGTNKPLRPVIKNLSIVTISITILTFLLRIVLSSNRVKIQKETDLILTCAIGLYSFVYLVMLIIYFVQIVINRTDCSERIEKYALLYPIINLGLAFICIFVFVLLLSFSKLTLKISGGR